jgi:hypothetical protein
MGVDENWDGARNLYVHDEWGEDECILLYAGQSCFSQDRGV